MSAHYTKTDTASLNGRASGRKDGCIAYKLQVNYVSSWHRLCGESGDLQPALLLPLDTSVHFDIKYHQNLSSPAELSMSREHRMGLHIPSYKFMK